MWIGSGMGGIDGLTVGDPVTAEQMRALFGCGLHPFRPSSANGGSKARTSLSATSKR